MAARAAGILAGLRAAWLCASLCARQGKRGGALLALALFLLVQMVAVSAPAHRFLHDDADQAGHQCAVTLLSQGHIDLDLPQVHPARPVEFLCRMSLPAVAARVAVEYRLLPERAPPSTLG